MTDAEIEAWWPELGIVVAELRRTNEPAVADLLRDAVRAGATSGEILAGIGAVLRDHRAGRSALSARAASAWDAVMADVNRAYPGSSLSRWFARLTAGRRKKRSAS